jgi:tripartite-type tricarboxylate transporter receptor subunit TctC
MRSPLSRLAAHMPRIWLTVATMLTASALPAHAQQPAAAPAFPTRPITLIMPFPAGGPSDALGRAVGAKMSSALGVPVVVENVGGVGGSVGLQKLARAPADGYTIGFGTIGTHAANMILYRKPMYDAANDHVPLGLVGSAPLLLLVKKDLPVADFPQFVAHLKTHKASMSYGSAGVGSIAHLACLMMLSELDIDVMHVPYKGVAPAMTGLMGGETDFMCDQTTTAMAHLEGGRIKAVAALTREPVSGLPKVAPARASGLVKLDVRSWNGLFAPRGTPPAIVTALNAAILKALADPDLTRQMSAVGVTFPDPATNTPANLADVVRTEIARLRPVLLARNVHID